MREQREKEGGIGGVLVGVLVGGLEFICFHGRLRSMLSPIPNTRAHS